MNVWALGCSLILVYYYTLRPPISKTIFVKHFRDQIMAFPFVLFHRDCFFNFCCLVRQRCSVAYLLKLFLFPQCVHTTLFQWSGRTNLSLLAGVCAACMLAYRRLLTTSSGDICRCLQMKWWAAVTVVAIQSQKTLLMCPYVSSGKFSVLTQRCARALLHNLQPTSDRRLIFASHLATLTGTVQTEMSMSARLLTRWRGEK